MRQGYRGPVPAKGLSAPTAPADPRRPFIAAGVDIPAGGLFTGAEGLKMAAEAATFGGAAGGANDPCYHQACDTIADVNLAAFDINADAVAYAMLPVRDEHRDDERPARQGQLRAAGVGVAGWPLSVGRPGGFPAGRHGRG
jgi:hypothetical protein